MVNTKILEKFRITKTSCKPRLFLMICLFISLFYSCSDESQYSLADFYSKNEVLDQQVNRIFAKLSDQECVGQMVCVMAGELGNPERKVDSLINRYHIGGILLISGNLPDLKDLVRHLKSVVKTKGCLPILFSADAEPTLLNQKIKGLPAVPNTDQISDDGVNEAVAAQISKQLRKMGVRQNYAPVCDLSQNKTALKNRSYGETEGQIGKLPISFIAKSQEMGVVATAKHFPGHGTVETDSHVGLPFINAPFKELGIFKKAIRAQVICVMVGHIAVNNGSRFDTDSLPASLSPKIVYSLLRDSLQFNGVVVTDALNMGAVRRYENAAFLAAKAGANVVLEPKSVKEFVEKMEGEMIKDKALKKHVYSSAKKMIRLKICLGLIKRPKNEKIEGSGK